MTIDNTSVFIAVVPVAISMIGMYFQMNSLIARQDVKISTLQREMKEMKRHNEKITDRLFEVLDVIKTDVVDIKVHFGACANFKTHNNG